ncbi:hypothetical protein AOLI_G00118370 [Acnodon oligacanthus]
MHNSLCTAAVPTPTAIIDPSVPADPYGSAATGHGIRSIRHIKVPSSGRPSGCGLYLFSFPSAAFTAKVCKNVDLQEKSWRSLT